MASNCTDATNENYQLYWFDYFVSVGYIAGSDVTNPYAPYGKCTRSLLWLSYLINLVHFFLLSSSILYILTHHRNQSGFWWPFVTWIASLVLVVASIILFLFLKLNIRLFSILIIAVQLSTLIILWISVLIVVLHAFAIQYRYQRCLLLFIIILFLLQIGCFVAQALITIHCLFNLKFVTSFLDYGYWAAIIAAAGTIISTLFLDYIFMWCVNRNASPGINPAPVNLPSRNENRATSPIDSVILEDFRRRPEAAPHLVYSNNDRTRRFRIQAANPRVTDESASHRVNRSASDLFATSEA